MFKQRIKNFIQSIINKQSVEFNSRNDVQMLAIGTLLANQQNLLNSSNINDYEFKIFSQFGDDGIIQYLIKNVLIENQIFIEFGVEDFLESNTRFLMANNNWRGLVMDGSEDAINKLRNQIWFWKYDLQCKSIFITKENINQIFSEIDYSNIGILHIDLDGNDYHILKEIDLTKLNPSIIIMEYNSVFGDERAITIPYKSDFARTEAHYSNLYWGASLGAITDLANAKNYQLVGCNLAGNNAYFVRTDLLNEKIKAVTAKSAYKTSLYRESRNQDGSLSYLRGSERLAIIAGLDVFNTRSGTLEKL